MVNNYIVIGSRTCPHGDSIGVILASHGVLGLPVRIDDSHDWCRLSWQDHLDGVVLVHPHDPAVTWAIKSNGTCPVCLQKPPPPPPSPGIPLPPPPPAELDCDESAYIIIN